MKKKIVVTCILLAVAGAFAYSLFQAERDREGRILFSVLLIDFQKKMPRLEEEIMSSGKMTPKIEEFHGTYTNSTETMSQYSYTVQTKEKSIEVTFPVQLPPLSEKTVILEPVVTSYGVKWLCNKGTVEEGYRSTQCRNEQGLTHIVRTNQE